MKIIKLLFQEILLGNILSAPLRLLQREIITIKEEFSKKVAEFLLKILWGLFLVILLIVGFFFGLLALAIYLNELWYSTYKGFLVVGTVCVLVSVVALSFFNPRSSSKKNNNTNPH